MLSDRAGSSGESRYDVYRYIDIHIHMYDTNTRVRVWPQAACSRLLCK